MKIFPNESFGFLRITVERPLHLRWEVNDETVAAVECHKAVAKLEPPRRDTLLAALRARTGHEFATENLARATVQEILAATIGQNPASLLKAVVESLAVRDPEAPVITDRSDNPKPDPTLRDHENVPLPPVPVAFEDDPTARFETIEYRSAIDDYMETEVLPYVPDAGADHTKTKIAYEIPLTRHFYTYTPPRPLSEITAEIKRLESEIQALLTEIDE